MDCDPTTEEYVMALARQGKHRQALEWLDKCTERAMEEVGRLIALRRAILDTLEFES